MKKNTNQLKTGVILSYINLALGTLIPFFYTPLMLDLLGQAEYGLYTIASSVTGYLSLLTFGLGTTVIRYIAKYRAEGDREGEQKIVGLFMCAYAFFALLILLGGGILSAISPAVFAKGLTADELPRLQILVLIQSFSMAAMLPFSVFNSIALSHERYLFRRTMDILATLLGPVLNLTVLLLGQGSIGLALASFVLQAIFCPFNVYYCWKRLGIRPKFARADKKLVKEIIGFSGVSFLGAIVDMLFWATDKVLLGAMVSSSTVAVYNIGVHFNSIIQSLSGSISGVLMPRVTSMVVHKQDKSELSSLFIRTGRLQFLLLALVISGYISFGKPFVQIWAGPDYHQSYYIALMTMIPLLIPLIQNVGINIVVAQNKHAFRSVVYLIIAIANAVSTYLVIPTFGGMGAAVCSGISYILGQGIIMNLYYHKVTGIDIPRFWKEILKMSVVPVLMTTVMHYLSKCIDFYSLSSLFIGIAVYTIVYCLLMYLCAMNDYEKDIVNKFLRKLHILH